MTIASYQTHSLAISIRMVSPSPLLKCILGARGLIPSRGFDYRDMIFFAHMSYCACARTFFFFFFFCFFFLFSFFVFFVT